MAEEGESSQEKTEEPSSKRQEEAKQQGQVARSKDFNATIILMFTAGCFYIFGHRLAGHLATMMRDAFEFDAEITVSPAVAFEKYFILLNTGLSPWFPF